jgi:2'-5' RNA ligase
LGQTPVEQLAGREEAMAQAAASRVGELTLAGIGAFPSLARPRVLWAGLEGDVDGLRELQAKLETGLSALGFPREERAFSPHMTLGRVRDRARPAEIQQMSQALRTVTLPASSFTASSLVFFQSTLTPKGPVYREIGVANLE